MAPQVGRFQLHSSIFTSLMLKRKLCDINANVRSAIVVVIFDSWVFIRNGSETLESRYSSGATMPHRTPTFVTRTLPSASPRTETLSNFAAAYKPDRKRLRLRSSVPTP